MPHDDRGKEGIAIVRKYSFFDFVIGKDEGLCVVPISENFARSLDLKKFFFELGGFVVVEPMGVFFPTEDLKL